LVGRGESYNQPRALLLGPGKLFRSIRAKLLPSSTEQQILGLGEVCVTLRVLLLEHTVGGTNDVLVGNIT